MVVAVIDGMAGGIGAQVIKAIREELPPYIELYALGDKLYSYKCYDEIPC